MSYFTRGLRVKSNQCLDSHSIKDKNHSFIIAPVGRTPGRSRWWVLGETRAGVFGRRRTHCRRVRRFRPQARLEALGQGPQGSGGAGSAQLHVRRRVFIQKLSFNLDTQRKLTCSVSFSLYESITCFYAPVRSLQLYMSSSGVLMGGSRAEPPKSVEVDDYGHRKTNDTATKPDGE